jgi:hypothetical protein
MDTFSDEFLKNNVSIAEYPLLGVDGSIKGKIAILQCLASNPCEVLNYAVYKYTGGEPCHQFIDMSMCNPWQRIIISDCLNKGELNWITMESEIRDRKIEDILKYLNQ